MRRGILRGKGAFWPKLRGWLPPTYLLVLASCAKIGDPLPPLVRIPEPVTAQLVQQAQDGVEILINPPLEDVKELEIYRECGNSLPAEFGGALLTQIELGDLRRNPHTGSFVVEDPEPRFGEPCRYQIRVKNEQGRSSKPSPTLQTKLMIPPGIPTELTAEVQEQQIIVRWKAPAENMDGSKPANVVGYLVNFVHVVSDSQFVDQEIAFGEPVHYQVQAIGNLEQPVVLSQPSQPLRVLPVDTFAPMAPVNLTAIPLDLKVQLLWDVVTNADLAGYYIYRGDEPEGLEKSSPLVTINRYIDPEPPIGTVSYYAVTAIDETGNESVLSEHVTVVVSP